MASDVFVSHAPEDQVVAAAVCAALTAHGIPCVTAAGDPDPENLEAVKTAHVLVLIFSANANRSAPIRLDVECAVNYHKPVIPFRIQNVPPTASLDYFITKAGTKGHLPIEAAAALENIAGAPLWLDASAPPLEQHLPFLVQIIQKILAVNRAETAPPAIPPPVLPETIEPAAVSPGQVPDETVQTARLEPGMPPTEPILDPGPPVSPDASSFAPVSPAGPKPSRKLQITAALLGVALLIASLGWLGNSIQSEQALNAARSQAAQAQAALETAQNNAAQAQTAAAQAQTAAAARPQIRLVPDQYSTIQAALDAAVAGDIVEVKAGTYTESLVFHEGIQLIGEGKDVVTVQSPATSAVLSCTGIKKGLISGLTFAHQGLSSGTYNRYMVVGIWADSQGIGSSVALTDCQIQAGDGNGIFIANSSPRISGCIVQNNRWGGIVVDGTSASPVLERNWISDNGQSGIIFQNGAAGSAIENTCQDNKDSGIVVFGSGTNPRLVSNIARNNSNAGLWCEAVSSPGLTDNLASGNGGQDVVTNGQLAK